MSRHLGTTVPASVVEAEIARGELAWGETEQRWVKPTRVAPRRYESEMVAPAMGIPGSPSTHRAGGKAIVKITAKVGFVPAPEGDAEMRRDLAVRS